MSVTQACFTATSLPGLYPHFVQQHECVCVCVSMCVCVVISTPSICQWWRMEVKCQRQQVNWEQRKVKTSWGGWNSESCNLEAVRSTSTRFDHCVRRKCCDIPAAQTGKSFSILIRAKILICNLNLASTNCRLDAECRLFWISYCVCG